MIRCPKCGNTNITKVGNTHYICNDGTCNGGKRIQFKVIYDDKKEFPYNHIFSNRNIKEFYKTPYLQTPKIGDE